MFTNALRFLPAGAGCEWVQQGQERRFAGQERFDARVDFSVNGPESIIHFHIRGTLLQRLLRGNQVLFLELQLHLMLIKMDSGCFADACKIGEQGRSWLFEAENPRLV